MYVHHVCAMPSEAREKSTGSLVCWYMNLGPLTSSLPPQKFLSLRILTIILLFRIIHK